MLQPLAEKKDIYKTQPKVLIICEDSKSCKIYIEDAAIHYRAHAEVIVEHCGKTNPLGIVSTAVARKSRFDKVYCVVDRDTHERWEEAIALAALNGIEVFASHPCFEYWILLHHRFTRKGYVAEGGKSPAEVLIRELRQEIGMEKYAKGDTAKLFGRLLNKLPDARTHADRGLRAVDAEGELNPSTRLHYLLTELEALGELTLKQ